jgi:signal transduction histidine kinase
MAGRTTDVTARSGPEERRAAAAADRAARDRAELSSRAKDEALAIVAHELRTPLMAIAAAAHLLERASAADPTVDHACRVLRRQVEHLTRLADDLLADAHACRAAVVKRHAVDLGRIAQDVIADHRAAARLDRHTVSVHAAPVWVDGDAVQLRQVVDNLLSNAVRYTPPGGRISVAVAAHGALAHLRVADTGIGITPGLLPRIFDPFHQPGRSAGQAREGLGLGLALVSRLVRLHGGTVEVASRGSGRGSTFVVRLPRRTPVTTDAAELV